MNMEMISALFSLFSGLDDPQTYQPLLMTAVQEVRGSLRPECDDTDARLCYLVAALANLRYVQLCGTREKAMATYAGTIAKESDSSQRLFFAEQLVSSYRGLCCDLLREKKFFFSGIEG